MGLVNSSTVATVIVTAFGILTLVLVNLRTLFAEAARTLRAWKSLRRAWRETGESEDL
jgi:hypothetical protein